MRKVIASLSLVLSIAALTAIANADEKKGGTVITGPAPCEKEKVQVCEWVDDGQGGEVRKCKWVDGPNCAIYLQGGGSRGLKGLRATNILDGGLAPSSGGPAPIGVGKGSAPSSGAGSLMLK